MRGLARHGDGLVRDFHPLPRGIGVIIAQTGGNVKGRTVFFKRKLLRRPRGRIGEVGENYSAAFKLGFIELFDGTDQYVFG